MGGTRLFSVMPNEKIRGNGHKPHHREFHTSNRKNFFTLRVIEDWNKVLREVLESPSLEIFKIHLTTFLCKEPFVKTKGKTG